MADILLVLMRIEELEERVGETYEWLSGLFSNEMELRSFFEKMSSDERRHRDLASYQIRVVRKNRAIFSDIDVDMGVIEDQLSRIKKFRSGAPTADSAIQFALEIEKSLCEQYYKDVLKQSNAEVSALMDNLAKACEDHYEDCLAIAEKCGLKNNA